MNNQRRDAIRTTMTKLEERDAFDNMPESRQYSEKGEAMEEAADLRHRKYMAAEDMYSALVAFVSAVDGGSYAEAARDHAVGVLKSIDGGVA